MSSIGERTLFTVTSGRSIQVSADGSQKFKAGGVTIDWNEVPAVTTETTYEDSVVVPAGAKALRYGSIVYRLNSGKYGLANDDTTLVKGETYIVNETWLEEDLMSDHPGVIDGGRVFKDRILMGTAKADEVQRLTVTATGGTFKVIVNYDGETYATDDIAYNASAGTLDTALEALPNIGAGNVAVTKDGADFILTFGGDLAATNVGAVIVDDSEATGGTVVQSTTTQGSAGTPSVADVEAALPAILYAID